MLFNSWTFLALLALTFALFYLPILRRRQTEVLIASSLFFYAFENPWLLLLLCGSIAANSLLSHALLKEGWKRHLLICSGGILLNTLILGFFKYAGFLASLLPLGKESSVFQFLVTIPLPIGISFYTFEGISLLVDILRGKKEHRTVIAHTSFWRHVANTTLFVSFFPHLVSGPILKARDFYPQIREKAFRDIPWELVFKKLCLGYFLKLVVADNLKDLTFYMEPAGYPSQPGSHLAALLPAFSAQIYADFAGYSLIALGLARLFGYQIPNNFNLPYLASSLKDFWQRWHISLSQWLRDYLYLSLGGNRKGRFRTYFNLFLVMALGGLWHGAASSFLFWGVYHGLGLAFERLAGDLGLRAPQNLLVRLLRTLAVFAFVTLGWLLFKLTTLDLAWNYLKTIQSNWSLAGRPAFLGTVTLFCLPVLLHHLWHLWSGYLPPRWTSHLRAAALGAMLLGICFNSGSTGRFIYFQF